MLVRPLAKLNIKQLAKKRRLVKAQPMFKM